MGCVWVILDRLGIGSVIRDHSTTVLRVYSKLAAMGLAIDAEILALLEGLLQAKALCL